MWRLAIVRDAAQADRLRRAGARSRVRAPARARAARSARPRARDRDRRAARWRAEPRSSPLHVPSARASVTSSASGWSTDAPPGDADHAVARRPGGRRRAGGRCSNASRPRVPRVAVDLDDEPRLAPEQVDLVARDAHVRLRAPAGPPRRIRSSSRRSAAERVSAGPARRASAAQRAGAAASPGSRSSAARTSAGRTSRAGRARARSAASSSSGRDAARRGRASVRAGAVTGRPCARRPTSRRGRARRRDGSRQSADATTSRRRATVHVRRGPAARSRGPRATAAARWLSIGVRRRTRAAPRDDGRERRRRGVPDEQRRPR